MTFGQEDVAGMLEDLGEDVTIGDVPGKAIFRRADEIVLDQGSYGNAGMIAKTTHLIVERGRFPDLAIGVQVLAQGSTWIARKPLDLPDPRLTRVDLELDTDG